MTEIDIEISAGPIRPIGIPVTAAGLQLLSGECWLVGWSLRETTGAAVATVEFTSGGSTVGTVGLVASGSDTHILSHDGIHCRSDITLVMVAGSVRGVMYARYAKAGDDQT